MAATMKTLRESAEEVLKLGITNKAGLFAALPVLTSFQERINTASASIRECTKILKELVDAASAYALEHPSVFDEGLNDLRDNVRAGDITIDGETYHFTVSPGEVKRETGNATQEFLKSLPDKLVKTRLSLDAGEATDVELEGYGLYRPDKTTWSLK